MSITKFQNGMKGGCGVASIVAISAAVIFSMFGSNCRNSVLSSGNSPATAVAGKIGDIGGIEINASEIEKAIQAQTRGADLPGTARLFLTGQALSQAVQQKSVLAFAKERGISMDDASITKFIETQISPANVRRQLEMGGKLKPGASEAEFDAAVKRETKGKTLAEAAAESKAQLAKVLSDPEQGPQVRLQFAYMMLTDAYKAKVTASEDAVRHSFDAYEVKRITFPSGPGAQEKADAALAKIKGGASFESVMDANTPAPPKGQKKASETTQTIPASIVNSDASYAALKTMKSGETTGVVKGPYDLSITKLIATKSELPKDFETAKSGYIEKFKGQEAARMLEAELKTYGESHKPTFASRGYEALYKYQQASQGSGQMPGMMGGGSADEAKLREVIDLAKRVEKNAPDASLAALVRAAAFDQLYQKATNKAPLRAEYIETLQAQIEAGEDFDARMKLVDEYIADKKWKEAGEGLLAAARANTDYTPTGQTRFGQVASKRIQIRKEGTLDPQVDKDILSEQDRWVNEKKASDKAAADAARQQEEDAKRAAAQAKPKVEVIPPKNSATTPPAGKSSGAKK